MSACRHYFFGLFLQAIQQQCTDAHVSDIGPSSTAVETEEERGSPQAFMLEATRRCAAVRHDLLMARREAAAADAAVAAVAQVRLSYLCKVVEVLHHNKIKLVGSHSLAHFKSMM